MLGSAIVARNNTGYFVQASVAVAEASRSSGERMLQEGSVVSDIERYLFDLNGYIVIKSALSKDEVDRLNHVIDRRGLDHAHNLIPTHAAGSHYAALLSQDRAFRDLIDHPSVMPYLEEWIGGVNFYEKSSRVRLDHTYFIFSEPGAKGANLHLGGTPYIHPTSYQVQNGSICSALTVVSYALNEVIPGRGGFACIPGSHKSNFRCPEPFVNLTDTSAVISPRVSPGDAIIFTEALTHGSFPWTAPHRRRVLFYKYSPTHMAWMQSRWPDELLELCTEKQRALLQPPHVDDSPRFFVAGAS
jgi:ectoine hydroxylase-related dioxygenase (phytanoyl-CoA dioxygenase family)